MTSGGKANNSIAQIAQEVGSAVVRIDSSRTVKNPKAEMFNDPFFRNFFGSQMPQMPDKQVQPRAWVLVLLLIKMAQY